MDQCEAPQIADAESFEDLMEAMGTDLYWVRFFARPCCPAPDVQGAIKMLDHLERDVDARADLSSSEKDALKEVIEARKDWYPTSGLCRK